MRPKNILARLIEAHSIINSFRPGRLDKDVGQLDIEANPPTNISPQTLGYFSAHTTGVSLPKNNLNCLTFVTGTSATAI